VTMGQLSQGLGWSFNVDAIDEVDL